MSEDMNKEPEGKPGHEHKAHDDHEHCDAVQHSVSGGCPCCQDSQMTDEEKAENDQAINADPAAKSLSSALTTSFVLLKGAMIVVLAFFILDSFTNVDEGMVGIKQRLGKYVTDEQGEVRLYEAGKLIFVFPNPLEKLIVIPNGEDRSISLDSEFWPKGKKPTMMGKDDDLELEPKSELVPGVDGYNLSGDRNIFHSRWEIRYRISDPVRYSLATALIPKPEARAKLDNPLFSFNESDLKADDYLTPEDILRKISTSVIFRSLAGANIDDILYGNIGVLSKSIASELQKEMQDEEGELRWGIEVTAVNPQRIVPPGQTKAAFDAVINAYSEMTSKVKDSQGEASATINKAEEEAKQFEARADVYKRQVVAKARADAEYLTNLVLASPFITESDLADPVGIAKILAADKQPQTIKTLAGRLPQDSLAIIEKVAASGKADKTEVSTIAESFKTIQSGAPLYLEKGFETFKSGDLATRLIAKDKKLRADNDPDGLFRKENQLLNRLMIESCFAGKIKPMKNIYTPKDQLSIFLSQDRMKRISNVLENVRLHILHPGERSVLIVSPRQPSPSVEEKK